MSILEKEFHFYNLLTKREKRQFQHRIAVFISEKKFVGRDGLEMTERIKTLIAAVGCMLSFGRKNYEYGLINYIIVYPDEFFSKLNESYHRGEFNPREKALVLSWKHFEHGYQISDDNLNLGIHEFMHAMQLEAKKSGDLDKAEKYLKAVVKASPTHGNAVFALKQIKEEKLEKKNTKSAGTVNATMIKEVDFEVVAG